MQRGNQSAIGLYLLFFPDSRFNPLPLLLLQTLLTLLLRYRDWITNLSPTAVPFIGIISFTTYHVRPDIPTGGDGAAVFVPGTHLL